MGMFSDDFAVTTPLELNEKCVEYDLDDDDEAFVRAANAVESRKKRKPLTEDMFEECIDFLEKESFFKVRVDFVFPPIYVGLI